MQIIYLREKKININFKEKRKRKKEKKQINWRGSKTFLSVKDFICHIFHPVSAKFLSLSLSLNLSLTINLRKTICLS